jgi:cohesin loading factor subunit SCC2
MTLETSAAIMDAIFASPDEEGRGRLLKIIQDFLVSEASKHSAFEKGMLMSFPSQFVPLIPLYTETAKGKSRPSDLNMDELVGNTEGFADSGLGLI